MNRVSMKYIMSVLIAGVAGLACAQEGILIGQMVVRPFVATELTYDDNVFQTADESDDTYWQTSIGTKLSHTTDVLAFDSSVWFSQRRYNEYSQKDADRWGAAGLLSLLSDKSYVTGGLDFRQVEDYDDAPPYGAVPSGFEGTVDQAFDRTVSNQRRRIADASLTAGQQLTDDSSLSLGYAFYLVDYLEGDLDGWYENTFGTEYSYKMTDKTVSFLNAQFALLGGDGAPDNANSATVRVGVKNELTDKSTLRFGVGAVTYSGEGDNYVRPSFEVDVLWQATDKVDVFVKGRNEIQPTIDGTDAQTAMRASSGVRYQLYRQLGFVLSAAVVRDKELGGAESTTLRKIGAFKVDYTPVDGLSVYALVRYTDADQDLADDYVRFRGTIGVGYMF